MKRRDFLQCLGIGGLAAVAQPAAEAGAAKADDGFPWLRTARVFLIDAYQPPFAPKLEYDAQALAGVMAEMHADTVRIATMGKYAMMPGVRFSPHPELGNRDILAETIAAAKPRGIRVVPYISTGHKLAWSMVARDFPEYGQRTRPGGGPHRDHMFVGEDHGTVCWSTPYRKAFLDLVERVVRNYDVDGLYFDTWRPFYFWPEPRLCYCDGCRNGFRAASGKEIPWREKPSEHSAQERQTIDEYHRWYAEQLLGVLDETRRIVKSHKNIPLIYNIGGPRGVGVESPRVLRACDAFLYERGHSLLERVEGVGLARAAGLDVWPYVGVYNNWPRVIPNGLDYQTEIFASFAFGGAAIVAQPHAFVTDPENRRWVSFPFSVIERHEQHFRDFENVPYAAVVYGDRVPRGTPTSGFWPTDVRSATQGALAVCLYGHLQASSVPEQILDQPERLARFRVLYLASVPHLTAERVKNIERFVADGGGLLASGGASLYSAAGDRLERFSLEKLLCVRPARVEGTLAETLASYRCMLGGPNDLYLLPRPESKASKPGRMVPLWQFEPVEVLEGATVRADIVTGDGPRPILPAVIVSRHGKGRIVYLASSLESLYGATRQSLLGNFLRQLLEEAAAAPPPLRLDGPPSLIANLTQNGNRRVLHLLNWTGDAENEANYLPPVENVAVRLLVPQGMKISRVAPFPDAAIQWTQSDRTLTVRIPRIESYQGIAFDCQ